MAEVRLEIGTRSYVVTCRDGEETHLARLGEMVSDKVSTATTIATGLTESRQLLFASLLLADELSEARTGSAERATDADPSASDPPAGSAQLAEMLDNLAERIETLALTLENDRSED